MVRSGRRLLSGVLFPVMIFFGGPLAAEEEIVWETWPVQYVAALVDPSETSGSGAENWGLWPLDPGPRGVWARDFASLAANGNVAPDGWTFDPQGWWVEEYGRIMEAPDFPIAPGRYLVTGGREVTTVLTISEPDAEGHMNWSLGDSATIYDVTHLRCRAALYRPIEQGASCAPDDLPPQSFPVTPGLAMPSLPGCSKTDYQVLIVIGHEAAS